jgi:molecular chaperone GrpE
MSPTEDQGQGPVIRDRRRIDPATGQVRNPAEPGPQQRGPGGQGGGQPRPGKHSVSKPGGSGPAETSQPPAGGAAAAGTGGATASGPASGGDPDARANQAVAMLAERTADLQRLQAEYANYRKRVERDRLAVREQALANVLNELLPVLDDIGRAREHDELSGGFKSVADSLESIVAKLGLTSFGENGEPFDPTMHEALMHEYSDEVSEPTCVRILQPGYRVGERIIRPARVAVAEPGGEAGLPPDAGAEPDPLAEDSDDGNGV